MGIIVKTNPSEVRPSQDFLKENTLRFIKENYEKGNFDKLPPTPIVRKDNEGRFIAIDGHNLLAFYYIKNLDCEVYVAESKDDGLLGDSDMVTKRNKDLFEKYEVVLGEAESLTQKGIRTIGDLCKLSSNLA